MTLTPDALRAAKGHLGDLADSIHAAYWTDLYRASTAHTYRLEARAHLTSLAAAMGYRLVPTEGETK